MGSVNINVNVDASGSEVEGSDTKGNELEQQIAIAIQSEIIKQKRSGRAFSRLIWLLFLQLNHFIILKKLLNKII